MTCQPNIIFILADQLRAGCVGCYGNDIIRTPHIDPLPPRDHVSHRPLRSILSVRRVGLC
jgi:hypothetical protein